MGTRRLLPLALSALLLGVTAPVTAAAPATTAAPAADPCGYFTKGFLAFYNHCTTDGSHIQIKIDRINEWDTKHCVRPGITQLGTTAQIRNAWYTGKLC